MSVGALKWRAGAGGREGREDLLKYGCVLNALYQQSNLKFDNEEHSRENPRVPSYVMYTRRNSAQRPANRHVIAPPRLPTSSAPPPKRDSCSSGAPPTHAHTPARPSTTPANGLALLHLQGPHDLFWDPTNKVKPPHGLAARLNCKKKRTKKKNNQDKKMEEKKTSCTWSSSGVWQERGRRKGRLAFNV